MNAALPLLLCALVGCASPATYDDTAVRVVAALPGLTYVSGDPKAIAIKRYSSEFTRRLAFSLFYVIMKIAFLAAAPTIDFYRKYIHEEVFVVLGT